MSAGHEPPPRIVRDLVLALGEAPQRLWSLAAERLDRPLDDLVEVRPVKVSVDARGAQPKRIISVAVWLRGEEVPAPVVPVPRRAARMRPLVAGEAPIIVGTGPAGLWAALRFLEAGQPCVLVDRGPDVGVRNQDVKALRSRGQLNPESNLCFGEGGAGTYSDGKLYTRIRAPGVRRVYEDLVAFGAPEEILVEAHPHVGTNRLIKLLGALRAHLIGSGCELRFNSCVVGLLRDAGGRVAGVRLADGTELTSRSVVLATGHSARDIFRLLADAGVPMVRKPFAIGARVEHPQPLVDAIQYGPHAGHAALDAAAYALKARIGRRGVYSFCMCPGGFVIPTTTEPERLNVNGMSNGRRSSRWANSALVVTVEPEDFWDQEPGDLDSHGALAGVVWQQRLESAAYHAGGGGYRAPAQRLTDFMEGRLGDVPARSSYRPGLTPADLRAVLPGRIIEPLARAVWRFEEKMRGFLTEEAVLIGVETTTSSPVRILRDPSTLQCEGIEGLYPCGEGAGYAGGIVSSALEGVRVAEAILAGH